VNPEAVLIQEPPLTQGDEAQESYSVSQVLPKKPETQAQVKPEVVLEQEPPLAQGLEEQESYSVSHLRP